MMISGWIGQWGRCCLYWWPWWWLLSEIMIPLMVMAKTGALVMLMVTRTWPWSSEASTIRNDWNHNKPAQLLPVPWKCIVEMTQNLTNIDPTSKRSSSGSRRATEVLKKENHQNLMGRWWELYIKSILSGIVTRGLFHTVILTNKLASMVKKMMMAGYQQFFLWAKQK